MHSSIHRYPGVIIRDIVYVVRVRWAEDVCCKTDRRRRRRPERTKTPNCGPIKYNG